MSATREGRRLSHNELMRTLIAIADIQQLPGWEGASGCAMGPHLARALGIRADDTRDNRIRRLVELGWLERRIEGPTSNRRNMRTYISELGWQKLAAVGIEKPT